MLKIIFPLRFEETFTPRSENPIIIKIFPIKLRNNNYSQNYAFDKEHRIVTQIIFNANDYPQGLTN